MTGCDFDPVPPRVAGPDAPSTPDAHRPRGSLTVRDHHVRVEPAAKGWKAWTWSAGDKFPRHARGDTPDNAVHALLADVTHLPQWPHLCATCNAENPMVMDSAHGDARFRWYCHAHEPTQPNRRPKR